MRVARDRSSVGVVDASAAPLIQRGPADHTRSGNGAECVVGEVCPDRRDGSRDGDVTTPPSGRAVPARVSRMRRKAPSRRTRGHRRTNTSILAFSKTHLPTCTTLAGICSLAVCSEQELVQIMLEVPPLIGVASIDGSRLDEVRLFAGLLSRHRCACSVEGELKIERRLHRHAAVFRRPRGRVCRPGQKHNRGTLVFDPTRRMVPPRAARGNGFGPE